MLFNTYPFLVFLIAVICIYYLLLRRSDIVGKWFLGAASLFFYAWWQFSYVYILAFSIAGNFAAAHCLARMGAEPARQRLLLAIMVVGNLLLLGYYKYAAFSVISVNALTSSSFPVPNIVLPIAISFFTFQQIAFLVDVTKGLTGRVRFVDYVLFVTFFPQLIAGPIVHHSEMLPQFAHHRRVGLQWTNISIGASIFIVGLAKKVLLADSIAPYADQTFNAAEAGVAPGFAEAWAAAVAYALQIYFDFSAYSDMAIGIGKMFGIRLPINFHSPYKATSIIDFWRRWHITLSRFLKDYLYIPLGGSRCGTWRRYANLLATMILGGLWHGASWTFVVWGGLHGVFLAINHGYRSLARSRSGAMMPSGSAWRYVWILPTFLVVCVTWVLFRAESFPAAWIMLTSMAGGHGFGWPVHEAEWISGGVPALAAAGLGWIPDKTALLQAGFWEQLILTTGMLAIVWFAPNTVELFRRYRPALDPTRIYTVPGAGVLRWRPVAAWSMFLGTLLFLVLINFTKVSPFLYFAF